MRVHSFRGPLPPGKVGSGLVLQCVYPQQVAVTSWEGWLALGSGLALVGAWVAGIVLGAPALAAVAGAVTAVALLVFAATLRSIFGRAERLGTPLSGVVFAGGVAAAAIALVRGALAQLLAGGVRTAGEPGLLGALLRLDAGARAFELLPLGLLVAAGSVLVLSTHGRPRWLGWGGLVLAPVLAVAAWGAAASGPVLSAVHDVAVAGLLGWVTAISVVMFRHAATRSVLLATEPEPHGARRTR